MIELALTILAALVALTIIIVIAFALCFWTCVLIAGIWNLPKSSLRAGQSHGGLK